MELAPFQALLDGYGRDVHRFLVATVGRSDADDCYQETWLAVLRAYPSLRDASNLRGWVMTIAHRKALDHFRAVARRPVPASGGLPEPVAPDLADAADAQLWSQVARLPDKQRVAVALRFVTDAAYTEVAAVMGTSEAAARRNVFEGLKRLREEVAP